MENLSPLITVFLPTPHPQEVVIQSTKMVQGYLVMLIESGMHLKACNPGCVSSFAY